MKIVICDDLKMDREMLNQQLYRYFDEYSIEFTVKEYSNGENLAAEYEDGPADFSLLFLDIYMGDMSGMEVAKRIRRTDSQVKIIFTTTSPDFAIEGYSVNAAAYILKPITFEMLKKTLDFVMGGQEKDRRKSLLVKDGRRKVHVYYREIIYVESMKRELIFHLVSGEAIRVYGKLDDLENTLDDIIFLRCHQSYLVNMRHIKAAGEGFLMTNGETIPIRQREQKSIKDRYFKYMVNRYLGD